MYANPLGLSALNEREALTNLLDSLEIAEQAALQMAYYTEREAWIRISHNFGAMRDNCSKLAQAPTTFSLG